MYLGFEWSDLGTITTPSVFHVYLCLFSHIEAFELAPCSTISKASQMALFRWCAAKTLETAMKPAQTTCDCDKSVQGQSPLHFCFPLLQRFPILALVL